jgi:hypothetical protein
LKLASNLVLWVGVEFWFMTVGDISRILRVEDNVYEEFPKRLLLAPHTYVRTPFTICFL